MEMVAGSFGSEVRCGPFVLTYPHPFIFPAWTLPSRTHGACLNLPPLSLCCAGHELLRALLGPAHCRSGYGHLSGMSLLGVTAAPDPWNQGLDSLFAKCLQFLALHCSQWPRTI